MQPFTKDRWPGSDKLVIGIDVGTTQTAVSYAYLYKGGPQIVTRVSQWPGQPEQKSMFKIPSQLYYDDKQEVARCGAEAASDDARDEAEDNDWQLARHFKLHLNPDELRSVNHIIAPKLPDGVTVETIYSDFLRYIVSHTRAHFALRTTDGERIWRELIDSAEFVIAHPNAWGFKEQSVLRRAAVRADFVSPKEAEERVRFVSEGEASVHFCMFHGNLAEKFKVGTRFLVCDAGGSTVDTTSYVVKEARPRLVLEEAKMSGCIQAGGIFVNQEATRQMRSIVLSNAQVPRSTLEDWIHTAEVDFETSLKPEFPRPSNRHTINVDRASYSNAMVGIKNGRIRLDHDRVASFFEPSLELIKTSIQDQLTDFDAQYILLVGGYGESRHLQRELQATFNSDSCTVTVFNDGTSKAVSDGAVIWSSMFSVKSRRLRRSYGTSCLRLYDPSDPQHKGRPRFLRGGREWLRGGWMEVARQGALLNDKVAVIPIDLYIRLQDNMLKTVGLFSYNGTLTNTKPFIEDSKGNLRPGFERVGDITFDTTNSLKGLQQQYDAEGAYCVVEFRICVTFGDSELKAHVEWDEKGLTMRTSATIVPNPYE